MSEFKVGDRVEWCGERAGTVTGRWVGTIVVLYRKSSIHAKVVWDRELPTPNPGCAVLNGQRTLARYGVLQHLNVLDKLVEALEA